MDPTGRASRELARDWALRLPTAKLQWASPLRDRTDVQSTLAGPDTVWIRGERLDDTVRALPFIDFYQLDPQTLQLFPPGAQLPVDRIPPNLIWNPLQDLLAPLHPRSVLPGEIPFGCEILPVPASAPPPTPNLIRSDIHSWLSFCDQSPAARLAPLTWCAAADGSVLVRGTPIPSIPGSTLFESEGIAVTSGHTLSPPVSSTVLHRYLNSSPADLCILLADGTWERIDAPHFVPASRSSARLTAQCL